MGHLLLGKPAQHAESALHALHAWQACRQLVPQSGRPLLMLLLASGGRSDEHQPIIHELLLVAGGGENANASQFYITTGAELDSLDGKHTIFGEISEGLDVLDNINNAFVDKGNRPLQNIRSVLHPILAESPSIKIAVKQKALQI